MLAQKAKKEQEIWMGKEKKENALQKFVDRSEWNLNQFSKLTGIPYHTLFAVYRGSRKVSRRLAIRLEKSTKRKLKRQDFGYD